MKPGKSNILKIRHQLARHEHAANHLNEVTKRVLEGTTLMLGGDDSAVFVAFEDATRVADALRKNLDIVK